MADTPNLSATINKLVAQYDDVLKMCYEALAADVPQDVRDALRESIGEHLNAPEKS